MPGERHRHQGLAEKDKEEKEAEKEEQEEEEEEVEGGSKVAWEKRRHSSKVLHIFQQLRSAAIRFLTATTKRFLPLSRPLT